MLTTPQFYVMYIAFVLMATGGLLVTANAGPMAKSWGDLDHACRHAEPARQRRRAASSGAGRRIASGARTR